MKLSIVATLYHSERYVKEFYRRACTAAEQLVADDFEIILVNDGSPDGSLNEAILLTEQDSHVILIDLSRNFGHHKAMMTGLSYAKGDLVFLIDSDLEERPEWLLAFASQLKEQQCDVVYGVQERRRGKWFERYSGRLFYTFFRAVTGIPLPEDAVTSRLMSRRYVDSLMDYREREVFIAGLWYITGFEQRPHRVSKQSSSDTTYTVTRKIAMLIRSITAFSNAPLVGIFYAGTCISLGATAYIAYLITNWLFFARPQSGWTSVIASVWLLGGITNVFIGIVGIYLSKVFTEVKQRPYTTIRQIYGQQAN